jgi:hypothetical protein
MQRCWILPISPPVDPEREDDVAVVCDVLGVGSEVAIFAPALASVQPASSASSLPVASS